MADQTDTNSKPFDAMNPWRDMRDLYLDAWAKAAVEMVNSPAYAEATGAMLNNYLTLSAPMSEAVEKCMMKALEQLAMPSRADVLSIAERMTNIEIRLDDLDAKLDEVKRISGSGNAARGSVTDVDRRRRSTTRVAKRTRKNRK
jgi:hypothetical protein